MFPQRTWIRANKVTLVTFVWLFFTVGFQMCPQMISPSRCIVTVLTFVWLFSTVRVQMSPQIACLWTGIVALVAFVWFFSSVCFQMSPQITCPRRCKVTLVAFVWLFSTVSFCVLNVLGSEETYNRIGCIGLLFPAVHFHLRPQVSCLILCILAMVAFVCAFTNAP